MGSFWGTGSSTGSGGGGSGGGGGFWGNSGGGSKPSGGGGGGGILGALGRDLGAAGHFVSSRLETGASTIKSIGTGLYDAADAGVVQPWWNLVTTGHPYAHGTGQNIDRQTQAMLGGSIIGPYNALKDVRSGKFRDPIGDLIMLLPVAHGIGRTGVGAAEAGAALRAGEGLGAAARAFRHPAYLGSPRLISEPGRRSVSLYSSHNAARRLVQSGIDKAVNHALANERASGLLGHEGPVAGYGRARMGGTLTEIGRARIRFRQAMIATARSASRRVQQFAKSLGHDIENPQLTTQALLHSLHDNLLPEHEAIFHRQQAERGINPEQNTAWAHAFYDAAKLNVVHLVEGDRVVISPDHPLAAPLFKADTALEKVGAYGEDQLVARGLREPGVLADRKARVNQLVQRGKPLLGAVPQALKEARRSLEKAQQLHTKNLQLEADWRAGKGQKTVEGHPASPGPSLTPGGKRVEGTPDVSNPYRNKVVLSGQKLEEARARVREHEDRYGLSSPERRVAIEKGIQAREKLAQAAQSLFGNDAARHLEHIEAMARQYARANDVTPHEFYAHHLRSVEMPRTIEHLPREIAPLYEAAPAMQHEDLPAVSGADIVERVLARGDVKLPKGLTAADFAANIDSVMELVREGAPYRDWYERGAKVIKDAARRLKVGVKEMLGTVAVTSQGANPTFNLRLAAKAAREYKDTGLVTKEPYAPMVEAQMKLTGSKKPAKGYSGYLHKPEEAQNALEGHPAETIKRSSYYANFLHEIDPKAFAKEFGQRLDPVTVDRHIARMFGFGASPSAAQYALVERVFQEIAHDLGWKAKEVQAAAWVPWKARNEMQAAQTSAITKGRTLERTPEHYMANAADAYEAGHAENIGVLYQHGHEIRGAYDPAEGHMQLSSEHATPQTLMHEALHGVRQSLSPVVEEIARRQYAGTGPWTRDGEEAFVNDMLKAARGEPVPPIAQRIYNMTSHWIEGRGYVPMTVWEDVRQSHSPMANATGPVVGEAKNPMETHFATGEAVAQGQRRTDVAEAVAAHWQKMMRYFNTLDHRDLSAQHGSDVRLSSDDGLVREDRRTEAGFKLPAGRIDEAIKEALGILENKTGLPAPEQEGLSAGVSEALREMVGHIFPRLGTDPELLRIEETAKRGDKAPAGYKWVPEQMLKLKDLQAAINAGDPSAIGRFADNVNGAVTAATVYYKIGHLTTRVFTNTATNIMQGSLNPVAAARSWHTFHELTEAEQQEALAYAGTHYYEAAPGATGTTVVGRSMQKGLHVPFTDLSLRTRAGEAVMSPQWWAHHIDAPFRFNSIAYEVRKAGYEGVEGFRQFLQDVRDYNSLEQPKRAEVDGVLRRADREAIAYDRLNHFEKKYLTRMIWFYPWIKGSTVFTANSMLEHPFKFAALYGYGEQGSEQRDKNFGDLPSYAQGLTKLSGGAEPVVSDFNTFNPFSTAADLLGVPAHMQGAGGMLNPAYGAAVGAAESVNPYGAHTTSPIWDNVKGLAASAPEYQIINSALDHGDQSHRLYPGGHGMNPLYKNWLGELMRGLGGPATPRHVNPLAGHSLAKRERTGR